MSPFSLEGQTALVTGANTGIGQAIAVAMAAAAPTSSPAARDCDETLALIGQAKSRPAARRSADWPRDVLPRSRSTSSSTTRVSSPRGRDPELHRGPDQDAVIDVNLKAVFFTARQATRPRSPAARPRHRSSNIASLLGFQGGIRVPSPAPQQLRHRWWLAQRTSGPPAASTSTPSRPAISRPTTPRRCVPTPVEGDPRPHPRRPLGGPASRTSPDRGVPGGAGVPTTSMARSLNVDGGWLGGCTRTVDGARGLDPPRLRACAQPAHGAIIEKAMKPEAATERYRRLAWSPRPRDGAGPGWSIPAGTHPGNRREAASWPLRGVLVAQTRERARRSGSADDPDRKPTADAKKPATTRRPTGLDPGHPTSCAT